MAFNNTSAVDICSCVYLITYQALHSPTFRPHAHLTLKFSDIKINCLSDPIIAFVVYMIVVAIFAKIVIMIMQPLFDQNDDSCFYEDYKAIIDDLIEKKKKASE